MTPGLIVYERRKRRLPLRFVYERRRRRNRRVGEGSSKSSEKVVLDNRCKVKETLRLFDKASKKIIKESKTRPKEKRKKLRVDFEAAKRLKNDGKHLNIGKKIMGHVPGVEVGDSFRYRMQLNVLGLHGPSQAGIDYMRDDRNKLIAISIVASGGYDDYVGDEDSLLYIGQGGNVTNKNLIPTNQKMERGNLALKNSMLQRIPVRVIRGHKKKKSPMVSPDADVENYVYDGLYLVKECKKATGSHGMRVFEFTLQREFKTSMVRDSVCIEDISDGKEISPIRAVNDVDDEKPPSFTYMVKMIYPDICQPIPPESCNCIESCTNCKCITKNDGESPYNEVGAIVLPKPHGVIYECGPNCNCPLTCYLRVTQRGITFKLELFKTKKRGWGVRSRNYIPIGSFVCEYVGELLHDAEANKLVEEDDYLYDLSSEFTIDGARKGNIGKFINNSCSPNLYTQNVLYDHGDMRMPHVMLFAQKNIPPLQELTYHYNYKIGQVRDSNGNIRMKNCHCNSSECTGRLY